MSEVARRDDLSDRAAGQLLFARFTDEVCSGLLVVLMPTFRTRLRLTVGEVGWCFQVLFTVAALVEPASSLAVDLVRRRPLLAGGAAGWAVAMLVMAGARNLAWLLTAFALVGIASGPLAQTADVVLVEGFPGTPERIASRQTALDTVGALLAPAAVAVTGWAGLDPRVLFVVAGVGALAYSLGLVRGVFPDPATREVSGWRQGRDNLREVLADPAARWWIGALVLSELSEPAIAFEPVWLQETVGMSQSLIAVHVAVGLAASLLGLLVLDRLLVRIGPPKILAVACVASLVLYPAWLAAPGAGAKLVLVIPRELAVAPLWPILHSRALAAVPGRAGAVGAVLALAGLVPVHLLFAWLASRVGLTPSLLVAQTASVLGVLAVLSRASPRSTPSRDA